MNEEIPKVHEIWKCKDDPIFVQINKVGTDFIYFTKVDIFQNPLGKEQLMLWGHFQDFYEKFGEFATRSFPSFDIPAKFIL